MGHKKLVNNNPSTTYPTFLKQASSVRVSKEEESAPVIINSSSPTGKKNLEKLTKERPISKIVDSYSEQYAELLLSKNAHLYQANYDVQVASVAELIDKHYGNTAPWQKGSWVYYPWTSELVHVLSQEDFEALRTIRNHDLVTAEEQRTLFDLKAVCFGMSVGSASAQAFALSGISRQIKLVDGAVISGSNLNRVLTGLTSVGTNKAVVVGRQIYEMNPYSSVAYYDAVNDSNINTIFDEPWAADLVVDEIDDIEMKIRIRVEAKKRKLPVLMASELGDTIVLDVERFDQEPNRPILHGIVPGIEGIDNSQLENRREWMKIAVKILDPNNMSVKLQKSLLKIGTTIVTHPQLGSTVMMTGGVIAFAAKNIALNGGLVSGRYKISLEDQLLKGNSTRVHKREHKKHTQIIKKALSSM